MEFVVGRKYKQRDGVEVTLEIIDGSDMPYCFSDGLWRWPSGRLYKAGPLDNRDIVSGVGTSEDSPSLVKAARRVVELHDKGALSSTVGDSIAIEALRKALEGDNA